MIDIEAWAKEFAQKLQAVFGERLRFLGYQGSYGRGEATESSDIDIVTVLDRLSADDLLRYRELARAMPQGGLCCGFICGEEQLRAWPRYDLLGLVLDTKPVVGDLAGLAPAFTPEDHRQALAIGCSGLYHAACHSYLYGDPREDLAELSKAAFFCLRFFALCRDGVWHPSKRSLAPVLAGEERELLELSLHPERIPGLTREQVHRAYSLLIHWAGNQLGS